VPFGAELEAEAVEGINGLVVRTFCGKISVQLLTSDETVALWIYLQSFFQAT